MMEVKMMLAEWLSAPAQLDSRDVYDLMETPPDPKMGDFALPCFILAKRFRKAPPIIAQEIVSSLQKPDVVDSVEALGGYINIKVSPAFLAQSILAPIRTQGALYGSSDEGHDRVICIDYSSINIAKPFHIGHLSSTAIGHALYNIYRFLGYRPVGINYLGDWGTQFGKLIVAYKKWGDRAVIERDGVRAMLDIYVQFHDEAEKDEALNEEARFWFKKIEDKDPEALELFEWFKKVTLREVSRIYDMLGITFDSYDGESFFNDKMDRVIDELREKNLLEEDDGAWVVKFDEEDKMPPCLILKADGATLYATRDLASAIYRKEHYDFYKNLYVVAYQQNLHFRQVFKVLDKMGYEWSKNCEHVAFGMVSMEDGTLSTRKGRVVFLEDVFNKATEKAYDIIAEKNPELEDKETVARQVGIGALVYNTLSASRIKDITFSWDRALTFEGESGPYCQYTHVKCCSVLRRAGNVPQGDIDFHAMCDPHTQALIKLLGTYPQAIRQACSQNEPFIITRHITEIAQAYNKFYFENRILDAEPNERDARIVLTDITRSILSAGLGLLGIASPERM